MELEQVMNAVARTLCMLCVIGLAACGGDKSDAHLSTEAQSQKVSDREQAALYRPLEVNPDFARAQFAEDQVKLTGDGIHKAKSYDILDLLLDMLIGSIPSVADSISYYVNETLAETFPSDPSGVWAGTLYVSGENDCVPNISREFRFAITRIDDHLAIADQDGFIYLTDQTDEIPFVAYRYGTGSELSLLKMDKIISGTAFVDVEDYFSIGEKQCTVAYWGTLELIGE